jgi:hypothetical protein
MYLTTNKQVLDNVAQTLKDTIQPQTIEGTEENILIGVKNDLEATVEEEMVTLTVSTLEMFVPPSSISKTKEGIIAGATVETILGVEANAVSGFEATAVSGFEADLNYSEAAINATLIGYANTNLNECAQYSGCYNMTVAMIVLNGDPYYFSCGYVMCFIILQHTHTHTHKLSLSLSRCCLIFQLSLTHSTHISNHQHT